MPIIYELQKSGVPEEKKLRADLIAELKKPKDSGEPVIIIERPYPSTTHLYVIWSVWDDLEQMIRSRIILDAYTRAKGKRKADDVTVAMGLTPFEAERFGIKQYQTNSRVGRIASASKRERK